MRSTARDESAPCAPRTREGRGRSEAEDRRLGRVAKSASRGRQPTVASQQKGGERGYESCSCHDSRSGKTTRLRDVSATETRP
jgi:hypothetical protein